MIMGKSYKQFAESVIRWKDSLKSDEFLIARLRLTFYYSMTVTIILGGSSILLYKIILSNLTQSIIDNIFLDPRIAQAIIDKAQDILLNRFLMIDSIIIFFVIILGFLLTNKTLEPIESNMQKQKRFIADASHELRTPISVMLSGIEVNLNNKKLDLVGARKTLEDTLEEMKEFSKLSNTLLDLSKYTETMQMKQELFSINELVKYVVEKNKNLASFKNINLNMKVNTNAIVSGNKIELSRVFYNILDNAIKYTSAGGMILVEDKIESNKYIINISDTGNGMSEDVLNKVFDPFFRGDEARNTNGAGLGLTLSKKIIENHKGDIVIKSQLNKGTSVIITLPTAS